MDLKWQLPVVVHTFIDRPAGIEIHTDPVSYRHAGSNVVGSVLLELWIRRCKRHFSTSIDLRRIQQSTTRTVVPVRNIPGKRFVVLQDAELPASPTILSNLLDTIRRL